MRFWTIVVAGLPRLAGDGYCGRLVVNSGRLVNKAGRWPGCQANAATAALTGPAAGRLGLHSTYILQAKWFGPL